MIIRQATANDLDAIAAVQGLSGWDPKSYLLYDCRVAVTEGNVAGFLASREVAPGEREILNISVAPEFRRRGIGRLLLENELARSRGAWFLEVRASNHAAIHLYQAIGFQPTGRRADYYRDPPEAAIVMTFFS